MKAAPPLVFPSSRVLAGWWPPLAPLAPRALAVGHLLLHHVEALALTQRSRPLDPFASFVLRALALTPSLPLADLEGRLHVGRQLLVRVLGDLVTAGLVEVDAAGRASATASGTSAAQEGEARRSSWERRAFHFRDAPGLPFVPLDVPPGHSVSPPAQWSFDPAVLRRCVEQSADWKRRHGFPRDVSSVLTPDAPEAPGSPPAWQRVVVDQPEHLLVALVLSGEGEGEQLRGFPVDARGWRLGSARPALVMGRGWPEAFPEVAQGPSPETWSGAWRTWCQAHGVPAAEAEACALNRDGAVLRVEAPRELLGRLHAANGESPRDEVWLLAGEGIMRTAARVEVTPLAASHV